MIARPPVSPRSECRAWLGTTTATPGRAASVTPFTVSSSSPSSTSYSSSCGWWCSLGRSSVPTSETADAARDQPQRAPPFHQPHGQSRTPRPRRPLPIGAAHRLTPRPDRRSRPRLRPPEASGPLPALGQLTRAVDFAVLRTNRVGSSVRFPPGSCNPLELPPGRGDILERTTGLSDSSRLKIHRHSLSSQLI